MILKVQAEGLTGLIDCFIEGGKEGGLFALVDDCFEDGCGFVLSSASVFLL